VSARRQQQQPGRCALYTAADHHMRPRARRVLITVIVVDGEGRICSGDAASPGHRRTSLMTPMKDLVGGRANCRAATTIDRSSRPDARSVGRSSCRCRPPVRPSFGRGRKPSNDLGGVWTPWGGGGHREQSVYRKVCIILSLDEWSVGQLVGCGLPGDSRGAGDEATAGVRRTD
jgi:hypothetical protein